MDRFLLKCPYWLKVILINIYGLLLSHRRFSGSFKTWFYIYNSNLKKRPNSINKEQFKLLKENLVYAYENIPYYNRIFTKINFDPYELNTVKELSKIPFLTKDIIRSEFQNLFNVSINKTDYLKHYTSGSTGERLSFYIPKELFYKKDTALMYRNYGMWGIKPMDRRITLGGRLFTTSPPFWIYNMWEKQLIMSSHHLNMQTVKSYISKIERFKPKFIQGHPSAVILLADYIFNNNVTLDIELKVIFTTGETLTREDQNFIEQVFGCNVAQSYGSGESCFSAHQVPNEVGYALNYEHGFMELVGDGEIKEVVVTSFQNNIMPFVRYKTGDFVRAVHRTYSKEFNLPILFDEVIGRVDDIIKLSDGNVVLPVTIRMKLKPLLCDGTNYQVIQRDFKQFTLNLVDNNDLLDHNNFRKVLLRIFGNDVSVEIVLVDSLISEKGKIRNVICRI